MLSTSPYLRTTNCFQAAEFPDREPEMADEFLPAIRSCVVNKLRRNQPRNAARFGAVAWRAARNSAPGDADCLHVRLSNLGSNL